MAKCKSCGSELRLGPVLGWGLTWVHNTTRRVRCNPRRPARFIFAEGPPISDKIAMAYINRYLGGRSPA